MKGFTAHGVSFHKEIGDQAYGDCPFCGKENKFYVNKNTLAWDCKRCGQKGGFRDFLSLRHKQYAKNIKSKEMDVLSKDRKIHADLLKEFPIGWTGKEFALSHFGPDGKVWDIRRYTPGGKLISTPGGSPYLFNIKDLQPEGPIYLCEGEWDTICWWYVVQEKRQKASTLGVPGAGVMKGEWFKHFENRDAVFLYDNDMPGVRGEESAYQKLKPFVKSAKFLHWPDGFKDKFDIRDLLNEVSPPKAYKFVKDHLQPRPRAKEGQEAQPSAPEKPPISQKELESVYRKWLFLPNMDPIAIIFAACWTNLMDGDPIWIQIMAPPGGSKSELLMSLSDSSMIYPITSLTPNTLISGAYGHNGTDPSLLPKLNGKVVTIKDFTAILTLNYMAREEIFGTLRDVYDGSITRGYGNQIVRRYNNIRFTLIVGTTFVVEKLYSEHGSLGERFLRYSILGGVDTVEEDEKIRRVIENSGKEIQMRKELREAAARYLQHLSKGLPFVPKIKEDHKNKILNLAKFCARLRGNVDRDIRGEFIQFIPGSEVGTRLAKTLTLMAKGLCLYLGVRETNEEVYRLLKTVALNTVPDRKEVLIKNMFEAQNENGYGFQQKDLVEKSRLNVATVSRLMEDFTLLRIVRSESLPNSQGQAKKRYFITDHVMEYLQKGEVYRG